MQMSRALCISVCTCAPWPTRPPPCPWSWRWCCSTWRWMACTQRASTASQALPAEGGSCTRYWKQVRPHKTPLHCPYLCVLHGEIYVSNLLTKAKVCRTLLLFRYGFIGNLFWCNMVLWRTDKHTCRAFKVVSLCNLWLTPLHFKTPYCCFKHIPPFKSIASLSYATLTLVCY